jgi:hypothetical protein
VHYKINPIKFLATCLTIVVLLFISLDGFAQNNRNKYVFRIGGSSGYGYPSGLTSTENSGIPTINLTGEYFLNKLVGLGFYAAYTYSFYKFDNPLDGYKDVWKGWDIGVRGMLHVGSLFLKNNKADLYLGVFTGYVTRSLQHDISNIYRDSLDYRIVAMNTGGIIGFQYLLNHRIGFYSEAGFSRKFFIGGGISLVLDKKN